jgi:hypothetical protein
VRGRVIDGAAYAADLKDATTHMLSEIHRQGVHVGIATLMVGDDYAAAAGRRRRG